MSSTVIVALPEKESLLYNTSSEKVPHITLLYLGDLSDNPDVGLISGFVQHAAQTMLSPFGLHVDRRGVLGDKQADVLLFDKKQDAISDFRRTMLLNETLNKAYLSADQFPEWTPHLTLGYPTNPSSLDVDDPRTPSYVLFDRISIWVDDYAGPEYKLKHDMGVSMETVASHGEQNTNKVVGDFLSHYGVKGMQWGKRKADDGVAVPVSVKRKPGQRVTATGGKNAPASDDAKAAAASRQFAKNSSVDALSNKELQGLVTRLNLEQQYSRLTAPKQSKGKAFIQTLIKNPEKRKQAKKALVSNPVTQEYLNARAVGNMISNVRLD